MRDFIAQLRGKIFILICKYFKKNVYIDKGLKIYKKLYIEGNGKIYIGKNCVIDGIRGDKSQYVSIDTHSPDAVIKIGDNVSLYAARISSKFQIIIGNDVLIEDSSIVDTDFHSIDKSRGQPINENKDKCQIYISNRVCIGVKSVVTKGVNIGGNVIIAPGSVVTTSVKSGSMVMGNPAKPVVI